MEINITDRYTEIYGGGVNGLPNPMLLIFINSI